MRGINSTNLITSPSHRTSVVQARILTKNSPGITIGASEKTKKSFNGTDLIFTFIVVNEQCLLVLPTLCIEIDVGFVS